MQVYSEGVWEVVPGIGIVCDRDAEREEIAHIVQVLAAREGLDCSVCHIDQKETPERQGATCVILALADRDAAFRCAEKLWSGDSPLFVIYVAHRVEDVIAALEMPFFHVVRSCGLEQDLGAAFRKMGRVRLPGEDRVRFTLNGQPMLIRIKEILYLESEGHAIRLHVGTEAVSIRESLSQCEEKLKGRGFVRTYTSFLVNMYHIRCLEKENVLLDNGERLYVSRRRYPEVKIMFENYIRHLDFVLHT